MSKITYKTLPDGRCAWFKDYVSIGYDDVVNEIEKLRELLVESIHLMIIPTKVERERFLNNPEIKQLLKGGDDV